MRHIRHVPRILLVWDEFARHQARVLSGAFAVARPLRWELRRVTSLTDPALRAQLLAWDPDGMLILSHHQTEISTRLGDIPRVFIGGEDLPGLPRRVGYDDAAAGRAAARHLLGRGIRSALCVANSERGIACNRARGFREELQRAGLDSLQEIDELQFRDQNPAALHPWSAPSPLLLEQLQNLPRPLGVLGWQDRLCDWMLGLCFQEGIAVPEDVLVVGIDNDPLYCELTAPPLSSVSIPFHEAGLRGAELLRDLLAGRRVPRRILLPPGEVTPRASTARLPAADPRVRRLLALLERADTAAWSTEAFCAEIGCGRRVLERAVRKQLQRGLLELRHEARVRRAKDLLEEDILDIGAIAGECGFRSVKSLETLFHNQLHTTPSAYRARHRSPRK